MAIYRGIGGAGDSTTDATVTAVTEKATEAAASASSAATSASNAATSAANASTSETNASNSASNASTSETNASNSASAAATSASNASTSETNAASSASAASTSETNAASSASAASTSETNAATSESNAATSETNAASSASSASTSATNAATSASSASTSATNAATSATNAATSETNAATSASSAAASYDSFDDRYLGAKASDPTLDNDGDALIAGALYFNTTDDVMKVYEGSVWVAAYASLSGTLVATNNLSDVASVSASRTNLGLGTAATTASTDYATAAQGALADSAVQPADNISTLTNDSGYLTGNQTITLSGDATGSGTTAITVTVADDSHNHIISNVDGLQTALDAKGTLSNVVEDLTPQLGGTLDANGNTIDMGVNVITDTKVGQWDTAYGWGDHSTQGYLTSFTETNDLTAAVTWANVPDANITQSSVTQHQAALSITESQISDLGTYLEAGDTAATLTVTTLTSTTANITTVDLGNWTITESAGVLYFATGGVNKMKLDASGNLTVVGDVTAYGTV